jgi:hypothetical protein
VLRGQKDSDSSGVSNFNGGQINSVNIVAPVDGVLVISGHVFIRNGNAATQEPRQTLKVDGTGITPSGWQSEGTLTPASADTYDATTVYAVAAGPHTVTQELSNATTMFYNNQDLTALFIPGANASTSSVAATLASPSSTAGK